MISRMLLTAIVALSAGAMLEHTRIDSHAPGKATEFAASVLR